MSDSLTKGFNNTLSELVLTDVEVLNFIESLKVLEKGGNSSFILNCVAFEGETDQVWGGSDHLRKFESCLGVQDLLHDLNLLLLYKDQHIQSGHALYTRSVTNLLELPACFFALLILIKCFF